MALRAKDRFSSQTATAEDVLKSQTVGLVQHADFRKRRAEALEQKVRPGLDPSIEGQDREVEPDNRESSKELVEGTGKSKKLKRKGPKVSRAQLSFNDDVQDVEEGVLPKSTDTAESTSKQTTAGLVDVETRDDLAIPASPAVTADLRRLGPNSAIGLAPKVMTKGNLRREAQDRERLRREFLDMQEAVKATEIVIPFVFYDGTNLPGGACKVRKGDHVWLFLDRSRKIGAAQHQEEGTSVGTAVGSAGISAQERAAIRKGWARISVDDLMLVRGEIIIPHHYDFYHFLINKSMGRKGKRLFDYSSTMDRSSFERNQKPGQLRQDGVKDPDTYDPLSSLGEYKQKNNGIITASDVSLEGYHDDPIETRVVDRRWYERNKHIYPANMWEEYDPGKDLSNAIRKDAQGNTFFFS